MNTSKAARELAESVADLLAVPYADAENLGLAEAIQSAVKELVEKAQGCSDAGPDEINECQHLLIPAVAPWLPDGQEGK